METAGHELDCFVVKPGAGTSERWSVPIEAPLTLLVNGRRWVTLMCTPTARRQLALGFAYFAGLFEKLREVLILEECLDDPNQLNMRLQREDVSLPSEPLLTSGCGQGLAFGQNWPSESAPPAEEVSPSQVWQLMRELQEGSVIHRSVGGTHASALSDGKRLLALYEDIGRHNTLDKLMGHSLLVGLDTTGLMLLTSGRVSSEMMYKAVRMRVSTVISRTTPTDLAVELANRYAMTLAGYARGHQITFFSDCRWRPNS